MGPSLYVSSPPPHHVEEHRLASHNRRDVSSLPAANAFQDLTEAGSGDTLQWMMGNPAFRIKTRGRVRWGGALWGGFCPEPCPRLRQALGLLSLQLSLFLTASSSPRLGSGCPISLLLQELPAPLSWSAVTQAPPWEPCLSLQSWGLIQGLWPQLLCHLVARLSIAHLNSDCKLMSLRDVSEATRPLTPRCYRWRC